MAQWQRTNFILALIFLNVGTISWPQKDIIFLICKFIVLDNNNDMHCLPRLSMVSLLQVAAALISSAKMHKDAPICSKTKYFSCLKSCDLVIALIRSTHGDTKITLPPIHILRVLSPALASLFYHPHVSTGQLPVLRGEYAAWDEIFSTFSGGCISELNAVDTCI